MSDGMGSDGDFEYGRPRYQPPPVPDSGLPRQHGDGPGMGGPGGEQTGMLAPSAGFALAVAVVALLLPLFGGIVDLRRGVFALVGFLLPLLGGVFAIRRGRAAARLIGASGGALTGAAAAVWARRLGWLTIGIAIVMLFWAYGGQMVHDLYSAVR